MRRDDPLRGGTAIRLVLQSGFAIWRLDDHDVPGVSRRGRDGHLKIM
jgi:hypothetical protein